jgi:hypothetical protein
MENKTKFVTLRMTPEMHIKIKELAQLEGRTICSQINYILSKNIGKTPIK